ncbi:hypothetical protein SBA4_2300003 [Candidatus Sulfopaludibacter sp. SbA4]|nr:hypothetical protein SBA4_2300003 [Candidatus Sulfopaludibacter sp. SbA4]
MFQSLAFGEVPEYGYNSQSSSAIQACVFQVTQNAQYTPVASTGSTAPPAPSCSLELEYAPVQSLHYTPLHRRNHALLVVTDGDGNTFTMEGNPQTVAPPWGMLVPDNLPGNVGDAQWGSILTSSQDPNLCNQIASIETAENNYSNNEVHYNPLGPNSNSFINWLLQSGGVDQYFTAPPGTTGWSTSLYGTLWGIFPN